MKIGQKDFFIAGMYFAVHPQVYELVYIGHRCKASSLVNHRYAFVNMGEQVFFFPCRCRSSSTKDTGVRLHRW